MMPAEPDQLDASLTIAKAVALLQLRRSASGSRPCDTRLVACLRRARELISKHTCKVHTLFVWATTEALAGDPLAIADSDLAGGGGGPGLAADELLPASLLFVGLADRPATCTETCLFAACSVVIATADAEFAVVEPSRTTVPLSLVRHLPTIADHLAQTTTAGGDASNAGVLHVACAQRLGLVSEIVHDSAGLLQRRDELMALLKGSPTAAAALQRWPFRAGAVQNPGRALLEKRRPAPECWQPRKRRRVVQEPGEASEAFLAKCEVVAAALLHGCQMQSESEQPTISTFVHEALAGSLCVPHDQRHAFQEHVATLASKALAGLEAQMQRAVDTAEAALEGADVAHALRDAQVAAADSRLTSLREAASERKRKLATDTAALRAAAAALASASESQAAENEGLDEAAGQKDELEGALRNMYEPLRDGSMSKVKAKKTAATLVALGKRYSFDETLLVGLPEVLVMRPTERSTFDSMVLTAFETQVATRAAELDMTLVEGAPDRERRLAAVKAAQKKHEVAKTAHLQSMSALENARGATVQAEAALAAAQQAVHVLPPELEEAKAELESKRSRLEAFRRGPLAVLKELQVLGAAAPAVAEAAPAAAEEDAPEGKVQGSSVEAPAVAADTEHHAEAVEEAQQEAEAAGSAQMVAGEEEAEAAADGEGEEAEEEEAEAAEPCGEAEALPEGEARSGTDGDEQAEREEASGDSCGAEGHEPAPTDATLDLE